MVDPDADDLTLAQAFRKGDAGAAAALVARHGRPLMNYLRAQSPDAEDLFQEAWHRAIRHIGSFKGGNFRAWLTVIARNCLIDAVRRKRPSVSLDAANADGWRLRDTLADPGEAAHARLTADEERQRIIACVQALPPAQREVFLLRTQQDLSFAEIAGLLGIPLNTALGRMHYAVTKLRRELETRHARE